jgi:hypothetical protein
MSLNGVLHKLESAYYNLEGDICLKKAPSKLSMRMLWFWTEVGPRLQKISLGLFWDATKKCLVLSQKQSTSKWSFSKMAFPEVRGLNVGWSGWLDEWMDGWINGWTVIIHENLAKRITIKCNLKTKCQNLFLLRWKTFVFF